MRVSGNTIILGRRDYREVPLSIAPPRDRLGAFRYDEVPVIYRYHPLVFTHDRMFPTSGLGLFIIDDIIMGIMATVIAAIAGAVATVAALVAQVAAFITGVVSWIIGIVAGAISSIMGFVGLGDLWSGVLEVYSYWQGVIGSVNSALVGTMDTLTGGLSTTISNALALQTSGIPGVNIPGLNRINFLDIGRAVAKAFGIPISPEDLVVKTERWALEKTGIGRVILQSTGFVGEMTNYDSLEDALNAKGFEVANTLTAVATGGIDLENIGDIGTASAAVSDDLPGLAEAATKVISETPQAIASVPVALAEGLTQVPGVIVDVARAAPGVLEDTVVNAPGVMADVILGTPQAVSSAVSDAWTGVTDTMNAGKTQGGELSENPDVPTTEEIMKLVLGFLLPGQRAQDLPPEKKEVIRRIIRKKYPAAPEIDWNTVDNPPSPLATIMLLGGAALAGVYVILQERR